MKRLIKSGFRVFRHDKLFLVVCILAVVFAVITPLLYIILFASMGETDELTQTLIAGYVNAKGQFFSSFSFGNNLGLIAPLLIGIVLFKDFTFGTVRNKIISGHSRSSIFMAMFVVCATVLFGTVLAHALLTLAISLPIFGYQSTPFEMADFWYLLVSLFFEMLVYVFAAAFVSWLCVMVRNVGLVIVLYIAVVFGFTMIAGILQIIVAALSVAGEENVLLDVLNFLQRINIFNSSATIGIGTSYTTEDVCYYLITPIVATGALLGHGLLVFSKKDLK